MKVSIKAAAQELGVREETLRRWELAGKITSERTVGGHRRYDLGSLRAVAHQGEQKPFDKASSSRVTIGYARVSSPDQLPDLHRQIGVLEIITVFSARLYGSRSHKNKQVMQQLKEVADEISRQNPA